MKGGRVLLDDQDAVQVPYVLRDAETIVGLRAFRQMRCQQYGHMCLPRGKLLVGRQARCLEA